MPLTILAVLVAVAPAPALGAQDPPIRVLVVTGGHDFEREPFFGLFRGQADIRFEEAAHPGAHARLSPRGAAEYDVIVLYDMWQPITEQAKADLVALLRQGKPVVALHHSLASYNDWPEYARIIGGRYRLQAETVDGVQRPASTYQHDVRFRVKVADPRHPVTKGISDFDILDETYGDFDVLPGVKPLLTTDAPTSGRVIAWVHRYGRSPVVYIQLGHDHHAYENPSYRRLVLQAVRWAASQSVRR